MKKPYEIHDNYACPSCGNTHIVGEEVDYGIYVPVCESCWYTGTVNDFLSVKSKELRRLEK